MLAGITWSDVTIAGAFLLGIVIGGITTTRLTRYVLEYLRKERSQNDKSN